jgi:uncharacterized membrane protein
LELKYKILLLIVGSFILDHLTKDDKRINNKPSVVFIGGIFFVSIGIIFILFIDGYEVLIGILTLKKVVVPGQTIIFGYSLFIASAIMWLRKFFKRRT